MKPRILGVDPGSLRTGWGLVEVEASRHTLVDCGVIRLASKGGLALRLESLRGEFETLVRKLAPTAAAVEAPFQGVNARAALTLAHARGVLLAVLAGSGVTVAEYAPAAVKKAVTGNGRAEKLQVQAMVGRLLGLRGPMDQPDLADALAVALCHAATESFGAAVSRARPFPESEC